MQDAWFVEVLDDDGRPRARLRLDGSLTVGRALTCGLVLDDPAVSPEHLSLELSDGGGRVLDRDSLNGLYRLDPPRRAAALPFSDGLLFQVGRTILRLRSSSAPLAPTLPLEEAPGARRWLEGPWGAVLAWGLFYLSVAIHRHWGEYQETSPSRLAGAWIVFFAGVAGAGFAWTGLWSLLGRIFAGRRSFWGHAVAAGTGAFLFVAVSSAFGWAAFALNLSGPAGVVGWILTGVVAAGMLRSHLHRGLVPSPRRATLLAGAVAAFVWITAGTASYFLNQKYSPAPRFDARIKPAWARLARPSRPEALLKTLPILQEEADQLAKRK